MVIGSVQSFFNTASTGLYAASRIKEQTSVIQKNGVKLPGISIPFWLKAIAKLDQKDILTSQRANCKLQYASRGRSVLNASMHSPMLTYRSGPG